jgi:hypothetical protein
MSLSGGLYMIAKGTHYEWRSLNPPVPPKEQTARRSKRLFLAAADAADAVDAVLLYVRYGVCTVE